VARAGQLKSSGERLSDRIAVGVLTQAFPQSLVDEVLAETGRVQQRNRLLPARLVVYFVLAMCLFSGQSYEEVARLLTAGLQGARRWRTSWVVPSTAAIWKARSRLGGGAVAAVVRAGVPSSCHTGHSGGLLPRLAADRDRRHHI
jgi:hypothetical protein